MQIVDHQPNRFIERLRSANSRSTIAPLSRSGAGVSSPTSDDPAFVARTASRIDSQNRCGSRSFAATETHATLSVSSLSAIQDRSSDVFPLPAGAETRTTRRARPSPSNRPRRGITRPPHGEWPEQRPFRQHRRPVTSPHGSLRRHRPYALRESTHERERHGGHSAGANDRTNGERPAAKGPPAEGLGASPHASRTKRQGSRGKPAARC